MCVVAFCCILHFAVFLFSCLADDDEISDCFDDCFLSIYLYRVIICTSAHSTRSARIEFNNFKKRGRNKIVHKEKRDLIIKIGGKRGKREWEKTKRFLLDIKNKKNKYLYSNFNIYLYIHK